MGVQARVRQRNEAIFEAQTTLVKVNPSEAQVWKLVVDARPQLWRLRT
jgi:hypothetical protein